MEYSIILPQLLSSITFNGIKYLYSGTQLRSSVITFRWRYGIETCAEQQLGVSFYAGSQSFVYN